MRKASLIVPGTVLPVVALIALIFPAVQPLLRGQLPWTADGTLHLYRLVTLDHSLSDGTLWARYAAGMVYGYGAPFFNYYSPLSLYPMLGLHKIGLSFVQSWLWGMVLYTLLAAVGAYLLGQEWDSARTRRTVFPPSVNRRLSVAGIITAAGYVYAPYSLYDALWRGTVSEYAALALLPWVLWALTRLAQNGKRLDWLLTISTFTLFILMHNVITLHGSVLIGLYAVFAWWTMTPLPANEERVTPLQVQMTGNNRIRRGSYIVSALVVALLLTAFFWLPALTETRYVKLDAITQTLPEIDVTRNLTDLSSLFALPLTADPTRMQPPLPIALSWSQIILAALAVVLVVSRGRRTLDAEQDAGKSGGLSLPVRGFVMLGVVLTAGLVFMNTRASAVIWQTLPLIRYSQFPWRLVGLASLMLAMLAGIGMTLLVERIQSRLGQMAIVSIGLVMVVLYGYSYLYPLYLPEVNPTGIVDAQNYERESGLVATSSFREYLPVWNFEAPEADRLTARFASGDVIARLEAPDGVILKRERWGNTQGEIEFQAESETSLVFDWFYFPGWLATLDGQPLEIMPSAGVGLIQVMVPAGQHTVRIWLANTDRQTLAWVISAAGVLLLMAGGVRLNRNQMTTQRSSESSLPLPTVGRDPVTVSIMMTLLALIALKLLMIDPGSTPIKRERFIQGTTAGVQFSRDSNFENMITLMGYDLSGTGVKSGAEFSMDLYWKLAGNRIDRDYTTVVTLRDASGDPIAQMMTQQPGGLATHHWRPGLYLQQRVFLMIPPETPPGVYRLEVSLYDETAGRNLDRINTAGNPEDVKATLNTIQILRPDQQPNRPADADIHTMNDDLALVRSDQIALPEEAAPGQAFRLEWEWLALKTPETGITAKLIWMQDGIVRAESVPLDPVDDYPVEAWQTGDLWRGMHQVYVPGDLESASYQVAVRLNDRSVNVATMQITAPQRVFTLPAALQHPMDVQWENGLHLRGYEVTEEGVLTLYWQTDKPVNRSLAVFVHVVNSENIIVDQSAGVPVHYTRPTTGWAVGEVISDTVSVKFPTDPGLEVRVGWFDPVTGQRVRRADQEADFLVLDR